MPPRSSDAEQYARFEKLVAAALHAPDPVCALREASRDPQLGFELRRRLARADGRGVQLSALLVARLRFERLLCGCPEAEAWFDRDARAFTECFRRYHHEVPPSAFFPKEEARLFSAWLDRQRDRQAREG